MRLSGLFITLLAFFSVSIVVRQSFINNTVNNYDHCDFFLLTTFENWQERGIADCHFSPIQTNNNPGDKHVAYYTRLESASGDNYFVSFPPFSFLFAYGVFEVSHITPSKISIQVLNLALHFVSAFFIYIIVFRKYRKEESVVIHTPSLFAFSAYLFIPILLYEHLDIYFPELLGQVFWIGTLYFSFRWFEKLQRRKIDVLLISLFIFFMCYTEWIGIFFVVVLLWVLRKNKFIEQREKRQLAKGVILSSIAALALTLVQYGSIAGLPKLFKAFALRYAERSGILNSEHSDMGLNYATAESYARFFESLHSVLMPFGYLLLLGVCVAIYKLGLDRLRLFIKANTNLVGLALLPGIIHLLVFFNSSVVHRHCLAVLGVGIAIGIGILAHWVISEMGTKKIFVNSGLIVVMTLSIFLCKAHFEKTYHNEYDFSPLTTAANFIHENSQRNEVIFLSVKTNVPVPINYISFKSGRNMVYANDWLDAREKLKKLNAKRLEVNPAGIFYKFNPSAGKPVVYRFSIQ